MKIAVVKRTGVFGKKRSFDAAEMMDRIREAVKQYPKAVLFELADNGFGAPFQVAIACILTIRTLEEVSLPAARRLFEKAADPKAMATLSTHQIDELIRPCRFHGSKSVTIQTIARKVAEEFGGELPCDFETVAALPGIGPKCANLILGIGCGKQVGVPVDIHVHRVTNRWGYVAAATPEKTMASLEKILPKEYWLEINKLLVPFGKHICTVRSPKCSTCPVLTFCRQVGVSTHR